jgi:predicted alpha/beta hydrolase
MGGQESYVGRNEFESRLAAVESVAAAKIEAVGESLGGRLDGLNTKVTWVAGINFLGILSGLLGLVATLEKLGHPAPVQAALHAVHFVSGGLL